MKQVDRVYNYILENLNKDLIIDSIKSNSEIGIDAYEID